MDTSENIFLTPTIDNQLFLADNSLEEKTAGTCDLFMLVDRSSVQLTLKEKRSGNLLAIEVLPGKTSKDSDWSSLLENVSAHSRILRNYEFLRVTIGITSPDYTLVPEALFKPGDEIIYFRKNFPQTSDVAVISQPVPSFHLHVIFGIEKELEKELRHLFQDPQILHYTQGFLAGIGINRKLPDDRQMWLNVRQGKIDIIVYENKKLLLLNSFNWEINEDILYYALFVCEQLELKPEKLSLTATGEIERSSILHQLLQKYIRNVSLPAKPSTLAFAADPETIPLHHYIMLYNLTLCE